MPTAPSVVVVTIPAAITGKDREAAAAAATAYRNAMLVFDESLAAPTKKDWEPEIRRYSGDPAAVRQVDLVDTFVKNGLHQTGVTTYRAAVTKVTTGNVDLHVCVDVSESNVVDKNGRSVVAPGPRRFYRNYSVGRYKDQPGGWLLNQEINITPAQPC